MLNKEFFFAALFFISSATVSEASTSSNVQDSTMQFTIVRRSELGGCDNVEDPCIINAVGRIDESSLPRFHQFVSNNNIQFAIVRFDSIGGELPHGIALGRVIRSLGFDTGIRTYLEIDESFSTESVDGTDGEVELPLCRAGQSQRELGNDCIEQLIRQRLREQALKNDGPVENVLDRDFENTIEYGRCDSACGIAFLGGVNRVYPGSEDIFIPRRRGVSRVQEIVSQFTRGNRGNSAGDEVRLLGFHAFSPDSEPNLRPGEGMRTGAVWAQQFNQQLNQYLRDIGMRDPATVLSFTTRALEHGDVPTEGMVGDMYYPTTSELYDSGVLVEGRFDRFSLRGDVNGAQLISFYSHDFAWQKHLTIFCGISNNEERRLAFAVSGTPISKSRRGRAQRIALTGLGLLSDPIMIGAGRDVATNNGEQEVQDLLSLRSGIFSQTVEWVTEIWVNGELVQESGQLLSETSQPCLTDDQPIVISIGSVRCRVVPFEFNDGMNYSSENSTRVMDSFNHFTIFLSDESLNAMVDGARVQLKFGVGADREREMNTLVDFVVDADFGDSLDLLSNTCIPIRLPADKLTERVVFEQ